VLLREINHAVFPIPTSSCTSSFFGRPSKESSGERSPRRGASCRCYFSRRDSLRSERNIVWLLMNFFADRPKPVHDLRRLLRFLAHCIRRSVELWRKHTAVTRVHIVGLIGGLIVWRSNFFRKGWRIKAGATVLPISDTYFLSWRDHGRALWWIIQSG